MGKNKRQQLQVLDSRTNQIVMVDSNEEILTYRWLLHGMEIGIIVDFQYQPCSFQLSDSVKYKIGKKERVAFREHIYSPDFLITFNPKCRQLAEEFKIPFENNKIYVDVKGTFNINSRSFSIDQKWVYQKYGYYIYKLIPKNFMKKFGIIEDFKFTQKTKKPSKVFDGYPLVDEIFKDYLSK